MGRGMADLTFDLSTNLWDTLATHAHVFGLIIKSKMFTISKASLWSWLSVCDLAQSFLQMSEQLDYQTPLMGGRH